MRCLVFLCSAAFLFVLWASLKTLFFGSKCDMSSNLAPVIHNVLSMFEENNIVVYFDDGTLLGFYRDGKIMGYEFDVDMSIQKPQLEQVVALRQAFKDKYDYTLYTQGDYIFQKGWTMLYTLKWEPYLSSAPCARIYDQDKWYYADIYCDHRVNKTEMLKLTSYPPAGYDDPKNSNKMYLCDMEMESPENCQFEDMIFPLGTLSIQGRDMPVPFDIPGVLSQIYGANGWQIPRPKGIKKIICHPVGWWVSVLFCIALLTALFMPIRRGYREYYRDRTRSRLPLSSRDRV